VGEGRGNSRVGRVRGQLASVLRDKGPHRKGRGGEVFRFYGESNGKGGRKGGGAKKVALGGISVW